MNQKKQPERLGLKGLKRSLSWRNRWLSGRMTMTLGAMLLLGLGGAAMMRNPERGLADSATASVTVEVSSDLPSTSPLPSPVATTSTVTSPVKLPYEGKMVVIRGNQIIEYGDVGAIVDPASTLKVPIAAWAIARQGGISEALRSTLTAALVVSDNETANELVRLAGGIEAVNRLLVSEIAPDVHLSRLFGRPGDSHRATLRSMGRFLPGLLNPDLGMYPGLSQGDRQWLGRLLSQTPAQAGFNRPDDWCRFSRRPGLQKCGVSAGTPTELSLIAHFSDLDTSVAISMTRVSGASEDEVIAAIDGAIELALEATEP